MAWVLSLISLICHHYSKCKHKWKLNYNLTPDKYEFISDKNYSEIQCEKCGEIMVISSRNLSNYLNII